MSINRFQIYPMHNTVKSAPTETIRKCAFGISLTILIAFSAITTAYPGNNKTYTNNHYLFAFDYKQDYDLKKLGRWSFDLLRNGTMYLHGSVEDETFNIFINESKPQGEIFHSFAQMRVKVVCGADGPDGSRYCEKIKSEKEFTTPSGLRVIEFYLIVTQENYTTNTKRNSTVGPIYLVDISRANRPRALMIYPGNSDISSADINHLARDILKTIRMVN